MQDLTLSRRRVGRARLLIGRVPQLPHLRVIRCEQFKDAERSAFERIYESSFPRDERIASSELFAGMANGVRQSWVAYLDRETVGFAVVNRLDGFASLLEYLAVEETLRSRGIGGHLLHSCLRDLTAGPPVPGIYIEAEAPESANTADERRTRQRRIGFYERLGSIVVECAPEYAMPSMSNGSEGIKARLMWLPISEPTAPRGTELVGDIGAIMRLSYGLPSDHPVVRQNLRGLAC